MHLAARGVRLGLALSQLPQVGILKAAILGHRGTQSCCVRFPSLTAAVRASVLPPACPAGPSQASTNNEGRKNRIGLKLANKSTCPVLDLWSRGDTHCAGTKESRWPLVLQHPGSTPLSLGAPRHQRKSLERRNLSQRQSHVTYLALQNCYWPPMTRFLSFSVIEMDTGL